MLADHNHRSQALDLGNSPDESATARSDKSRLAARQVIGHRWILVIRPDRHDSGRDPSHRRLMPSHDGQASGLTKHCCSFE
jgi:hypothetical protein